MKHVKEIIEMKACLAQRKHHFLCQAGLFCCLASEGTCQWHVL